jgi:hypothetical protein
MDKIEAILDMLGLEHGSPERLTIQRRMHLQLRLHLQLPGTPDYDETLREIAKLENQNMSRH